MKRIVALFAVGLALATPALAVDLMQWGTSGDWVILQDPNHGNDCLAQATFSDGSMLRMGFQDKGKKGFLATNAYSVGFERPTLAGRVAARER